MKKIKRYFALVLSLIMIITSFSACATSKDVPSVDSNDFRVTAYVTRDAIYDLDSFQAGYIETVTDVILFGVVTFDEEGNINFDEKFETCYNNIKQVIASSKDKKLYINLLGPGSQTDSDDWSKQMDDLSARHSKAFKSDTLIPSIKKLVEDYDFDGVFFDYEYPLKSKYWRDYNKFIVNLDETLGDSYKIGMALTSWNIGHQNKKARNATDYVEIMSYDLFDDEGNHSSMEQAQACIKKFIKSGYSPEKLDLGLPFYGRPTDRDAYWYAYGDYYKDIAKDGSYQDQETGKKFYFNSYDTIKQKTSYAIDCGIGGVMVWAWNYDAKYGEEKALFNAIREAKSIGQMQYGETDPTSV